MFIKDILYFSKEDSEAEISVSDGRHSINCFAHPVKMIAVNQHIRAIYGFECSNITRSAETKEAINKLPQHYAYLLTAKVVSKEKRAVLLGNLCINLDSPIPKDIMEGEYISFSVLRLDCE